MPPNMACIACNATREGSNCCKASSLIISFLINTVIKSSSENCVILGTLGNLIIGIYALYCVFSVVYCNEVYFSSCPYFSNIIHVFLSLRPFQEERRKSSQLQLFKQHSQKSCILKKVNLLKLKRSQLQKMAHLGYVCSNKLNLHKSIATVETSWNSPYLCLYTCELPIGSGSWKDLACKIWLRPKPAYQHNQYYSNDWKFLGIV